jgi:hypothetical protein
MDIPCELDLQADNLLINVADVVIHVSVIHLFFLINLTFPKSYVYQLVKSGNCMYHLMAFTDSHDRCYGIQSYNLAPVSH